MIFVILVGCGVFLFYMYYVAHSDHIRYEVIYHPHIVRSNQDYTIFFIADIHRRTIKQETIAKITEDVDIVCIGGDLVEKGVPLQRVRKNLTCLKQLHAPIYFVWGNNDKEADQERFRQLLITEDVMILEDQMIPFMKKNGQIQVAGFQYEMYPETEKPMIHWETAVHEMVVLLTHKPSSFYKLDAKIKSQIHLVLAGHTHGGQIRLFGYGPYKRGGLEKVNNTNVLITEGYGCSLLPLRLGTRAECHIIQLKHGEVQHSEP